MASNRKLGNPAAAVAAAKAAPAVKEGAKEVNKDTKGALSWVLVGGVALGVFVVWKIANNAAKVANIVGSGADVASSALDSISNAIKDPNYNASDSVIVDDSQTQATLNSAQAQNRANALFDAMRTPGTNFQRIKEALTGITVADYVLVAEKFGTPRYSGWGEGTIFFPKRNLSYWISAELSDNEIKEIRQLLPGLF